MRDASKPESLDVVYERHRIRNQRNPSSPTPENRRLVDATKSPSRMPPDRTVLRENGMDMMLIAKDRHSTLEAAIQRASSMQWWPRVLDKQRPYNTHRFWCFIVKAE